MGVKVHTARRAGARGILAAVVFAWVAGGAVAVMAAGAGQQSPAARAAGGPPADAEEAAVPSADRIEPLHLQVLLDRAGFSPGVIDGRVGPGTRRALALYEQHRGVPLPLDVPALATYGITEDDAAGPFTSPIPRDLVEQAALPALGYTSVVEALAERFHTTPAFLRRLNPAARFTAGEEIRVPNVEPLILPERLQVEARDAAPQKEGGAAASRSAEAHAMMQRPDVLVTVSERDAVLTVTDASGQVILASPVTTGSEHDPLPIGEWKVTGLQFNPVFHYNPALFWDADPSHSKAKIPPGPNNPVGLVWIDLDKEHYGLHGTPEPAAIGRAQSHGCVRLTNWDAVRLAGLVKPGTRVVFTR